MLGILGFCDAKRSRSAVEKPDNTILFQICKYLAIPFVSGGGWECLLYQYKIVIESPYLGM